MHQRVATTSRLDLDVYQVLLQRRIWGLLKLLIQSIQMVACQVVGTRDGMEQTINQRKSTYPNTKEHSADE
jgi:hypothetical protein